MRGNVLVQMVFTPITLRTGLTLKNRLVVAPMTTWSSQPNGDVHPRELEYLHRRAAGGYGMVMTAACYVHPGGQAFDLQWGCDSEARMPSLTDMCKAIHTGGAAAVLQIHHGGRMCPGRLCGGTPVSASAIPSERPNAETPRALTEGEIWMLVDAYAQAAKRGKESGYDGVEIHGANTYLLQQFVSPHSNRRDDVWGQDRLKFAREVTDAVLAAVGPNYPVGYRFSPEEIETPGIRIGDTEALVDMLASKPLDWLHISLKEYDQQSLVGDFKEPTLSRIAALIDGRTAFIGVGAVKTLSDAERCLDLGADLVALARAAITEPEWPMVAMSGGTPKRRIPASGAYESLTLPEQLAERIYSVPGWFEVENQEPTAG